MEGLKPEQNICRICLEENANVDWNCFLQDRSLTYKDCYYLFTRLECCNEDSFPTILCRNCSNCLENINIFISKAIETHALMIEKLCLGSCEDVIKQEHFEVILVEENDFQQGIQNVDTFEDCGEEIIMESQTCSLSDSFIPSAEEIEKQAGEYIKEKKSSPNQQQNKRKNQRQTEIPTCCTICSKVLASKYNAIRHEKTHRQNRERNSICGKCGLKFYDKSSLSIHVKVHSENREKTSKCEFCDKSFYSKGDLNVHRRIHLGQMISCTLCTKKYARQFDLDKHMFTHSAARIDGNLIAKKKIFAACEYCGEKVRSVSYKSHIAKHKNVPLFKCSLCDKEFFSRDGCDSHLKLFHKKGNGERANLILRLKTNRRCTSLYMQQNSSQIFIEE